MSSGASHPETIGRYRILRKLGAGAMGEVYLARDPNIDRLLAIKTVRTVIDGAADAVQEHTNRLLREARAAGRLMHPSVVALFDTDQADGVLYLAFEYVEGGDLAQRIVMPPPLTLRQVLTLVQQVASGLGYAHAQGIVHRDIKPTNLLIRGKDGAAKIADFGIAKLSQSTQLTRTGTVVGSPQYMSPEQIRGAPLDGRSDLFSLGVITYELLTGRRPFDGDTLSTLVFQILSQEPPAIADLRGDAPPSVVHLVERLLAKDRDARIADAATLEREVRQLLSDLPAMALEAPASGRFEGTVPIPAAAPSPAEPPTVPMQPTATAPLAPTAAAASALGTAATDPDAPT
ncbi:MAG: serine/threonine-protein kinase, partial [Acidobacteriota bacterium]